MELVRELPASHHLASHPARVVGEVGMYRVLGRVERCTMMRLRRDLEQTPHHPNISPHISHGMRAEKRAALPCAVSLSFLR